MRAIVAFASAAPAFAQDQGSGSSFGDVRIEAGVGWDRPVASVDAEDCDASQGKSGIV